LIFLNVTQQHLSLIQLLWNIRSKAKRPSCCWSSLPFYCWMYVHMYVCVYLNADLNINASFQIKKRKSFYSKTPINNISLTFPFPFFSFIEKNLKSIDPKQGFTDHSFGFQSRRLSDWKKTIRNKENVTTYRGQSKDFAIFFIKIINVIINHGDQIGRIFALWAIVYFGQFYLRKFQN
jgi:hypothetical protein